MRLLDAGNSIVVHLAPEIDKLLVSVLGELVVNGLGIDAQDGTKRIGCQERVLDFLRIGIH